LASWLGAMGTRAEPELRALGPRPSSAAETFERCGHCVLSAG